MKKATYLMLIVYVIHFTVSGQETINQNELQSTVTNTLNASGTQAKRYEIAQVLMNSHHWQNSSLIELELYEVRPRSGYQKYILELGYNQGTGATQPKISFIDAKGISKSARIVLGDPIDHTTSHGGYINKIIPIYVDVRYYSSYKVKITHARELVTSFTAHQQIKINTAPTGVDITDFTPPTLDSTGSSPWTETNTTVTYDGNVTARGGVMKLYSNEQGKENSRLTINMLDADLASLYNYNEDTNEKGDFAIGGGSSAASGLLVKGNGNVGIGTANPTQELEVAGTAKAYDFIVIGGSTDSRLNSNQLQFNRDGLSYIDAKNTNGSLALRTGGTGNVDMLINSNGNVGIGTTNPLNKLVIKGDARFGDGEFYDDLVFQTGSDISGYNGVFEFKPATIPGSGTANHLTYFSSSGSAGNTQHHVAIQGTLGIGTTNPGDWKLAVNGKIRAKEIKVETGWSDFVFEDDYNLPTLQEVEQHIEEKGHLQDIPSAAEVVENGIFLGEMDSKLLQKIEELMLYTIQQQKEIEQLKKELETLKKEKK